MKKLLVASLMILGLSACGQSEAEQQAAEFAALDYKAAVLKGHEWYRNDQGIVVRVHPDRVNAIFEDGTEASVAIPEDQFFLSIAPWMTFTHPCGNHVPTGCTGELIGERMHMSAVDMDSGEEILNQMVTTQHDGFIDFWVPAKRRLAFTFHYEHPEFGLMEATEVLPTFEDSRTCITTMQLQPMGATGPVPQADAGGHHHHH
ncbi:CueP family metal-binding protein [Ferrimonas gelatinilytica]|uniref:Lipoprotein n=1 Tax=Ferrimonas gelatinilytica TaxID=1255257 RepID=A0ABP9SBT5_9GAMM